MNFEKLKDMGPFTDAMFNRIIAFQEKQHPAWDVRQDFDSRIKDLPLHALVFSNPDRDPQQYRHTVAPFYPLRDEMRRIAAYIRRLGDDVRTVEFECGNGFIGSLLGREGVKVYGVRGEHHRPNQIESFFDPQVFSLMDDPGPQVDVAFNVWMPAGVNLTPMMLEKQPKLVVLMYSAHSYQGRPQTGTPEAFSELPANYKLIEEWSITRPADLFHAVWPDLTASIEEIRHTRIYAATDYFDISVDDIDDDGLPPYCWENELEMALLAHEARQFLQAKGIVR